MGALGEVNIVFFSILRSYIHRKNCHKIYMNCYELDAADFPAYYCGIAAETFHSNSFVCEHTLNKSVNSDFNIQYKVLYRTIVKEWY